MEYPGAWHHVMNRGRRGEKICWTDSDCEMFLEVLRERAEMWGLKVSAWGGENAPASKKQK
jgi:putative transposase